MPIHNSEDVIQQILERLRAMIAQHDDCGFDDEGERICSLVQELKGLVKDYE